MSYEIRITREDPAGDAPDQITRDEWVRFASSDPEFEVSDQVGSDEDPVFSWAVHPNRASFWHSEGIGICTRERDLAIFRKMFEVAERLNAVVIGEGFEVAVHGAEPSVQ
jgi:hypothetical protein